MAQSVGLIVAAGTGERAGAALPKQYRPLAGKPVLRWAVEAFVGHAAVSDVRVVIHRDHREHYQTAVKGLLAAEPIEGGDTRQQSAARGLEALVALKPERVLIHDGARPLVTAALISRVADCLARVQAAAPVLPISDTLRQRLSSGGSELVPREGVFRAQTPQGFHFQPILEAHRRFADGDASDDLALAERAGMSIATVAGDETNLKLTTADDFALAERLARGMADVRTGIGFDVHRFGAGDHLWLCGVKIPHAQGLEGHSDADVGLHALTDAILGALGAGDIGVHFPSNDPRWRAAPSHLFLRHAADLARKQGGMIAHVDVTLICEQPKIGRHRDAMRSCIAEILGIAVGCVSVKATTTDGLGFIGRAEGIAAQAVATLRLAQ